ncbi:hypothetical protein M011DRAFT_525408, partial [Sporormia fimetaria CBS 119925]
QPWKPCPSCYASRVEACCQPLYTFKICSPLLFTFPFFCFARLVKYSSPAFAIRASNLSIFSQYQRPTVTKTFSRAQTTLRRCLNAKETQKALLPQCGTSSVRRRLSLS